jgi:hypothetical protein
MGSIVSRPAEPELTVEHGAAAQPIAKEVHTKVQERFTSIDNEGHHFTKTLRWSTVGLNPHSSVETPQDLSGASLDLLVSELWIAAPCMPLFVPNAVGNPAGRGIKNGPLSAMDPLSFFVLWRARGP